MLKASGYENMKLLRYLDATPVFIAGTRLCRSKWGNQTESCGGVRRQHETGLRSWNLSYFIKHQKAMYMNIQLRLFTSIPLSLSPSLSLAVALFSEGSFSIDDGNSNDNAKN